MLTELVVILVLVLANGFFSGAEIAVITLRKTRLEELAESNGSRARAVLRLKNDPERFLATVQVGITVVSATAAAFGGAAIAVRLARLLERFEWLEGHAEGVALGLVVAIVSYLSIVLGELVPKSLALRAAEHYSLVVAKPMLALSWLASPLVWFLSASANLLLKPFGDRTTFVESRYSAGELQDLVEEATRAGTIDPDAGEIATRALEFPALTAADVMVPRPAVIMISRNATPEEVRHILLDHPHPMPVYESRTDNIIGYVNVRDLLAVAFTQELEFDNAIRAPYFVPEAKPAVALLNEMRSRQTAFAMVVDEHGGFSGIVTLEDLVEELVGDILSEHSDQPLQQIQKQPDGSAVVSGSATIREVNRALGIELHTDGTWTTVAGLCLELFGRVPTSGESVKTPNGTTLKIIDASPRRIRSVQIYPPTEADEQP